MNKIKYTLVSIVSSIVLWVAFNMLFYKPWEKSPPVPTDKILSKDLSTGCSLNKFQVIVLSKNGKFVFYDIDKTLTLSGIWEKHFLFPKILVFRTNSIKTYVNYDQNNIFIDEEPIFTWWPIVKKATLFGCPKGASSFYFVSEEWPEFPM